MKSTNREMVKPEKIQQQNRAPEKQGKSFDKKKTQKT